MLVVAASPLARGAPVSPVPRPHTMPRSATTPARRRAAANAASFKALRGAGRRVSSRDRRAAARAIETELPPVRFLLANTGKAFLHRHGIPSASGASLSIVDAELQRFLRSLAEIAYHRARAAHHTRLTRRDIGFAYQKLTGSPCVY